MGSARSGSWDAGAVGDLTFAGIWKLNFQFAFCAFAAIPCPLGTITLLYLGLCTSISYLRLLFSPSVSRVWGILLLLLTFCFIQATHHLSISVRELGCQSHLHILTVLRDNPGSSSMSAHRYAETGMEGGLWGLEGHCTPRPKLLTLWVTVGIPPTIVTREKSFWTHSDQITVQTKAGWIQVVSKSVPLHGFRDRTVALILSTGQLLCALCTMASCATPSKMPTPP